jgi:hypothetical protein
VPVAVRASPGSDLILVFRESHDLTPLARLLKLGDRRNSRSAASEVHQTVKDRQILELARRKRGNENRIFGMKQVVTVAADQLGRDVAHQPFSFTTQLFGCAGEQFDELSASDVDASFHLLPCRLTHSSISARGVQRAGRGSGDRRQWLVVVRRDPLRIEASPSPIDGR